MGSKVRQYVKDGQKLGPDQEEKEKDEEQQTGPKKYSLEEVWKHDKTDDCWIIIDDKVYDVSSYMMNHPGGFYKLISNSGPGSDASFDFFNHGHSKSAKNMVHKFYIGDIRDEECKKKAQAESGFLTVPRY